MGKSSAAANVIDLASFRQRKATREREEERPRPVPVVAVVPVWFCWVPVWAPVM